MRIIIFPFAKKMRNNQPHPKNYPYWSEVIDKLSKLGHTFIQVGTDGEEQLVDDFRKNLSIKELSSLILECDTWIGVDSFGQHVAWDVGKKGIVLFSQSDPNIFGHPENINLLKDRKYLREKQFWLWEQTEYIKEAFVDANTVVNAIKELNV